MSVSRALAGDGLADVPFVAFDTETTGLGPDDRLVELALVRFCRGEVEAEWAALVDPGRPIPAVVTAIHGIGDRDVAGRPGSHAILPTFLQLIEGAALVVHHAAFDVRVIAQELLRAGLPLPQNPVVDTCALSRELPLSVPNHRLGTLARALNVVAPGHRALPDAHTAKELLRAYLRELGPVAEALVRRSLAQASLPSFRDLATVPVPPQAPLATLVARARAERRALRLGSLRLYPSALYVVAGLAYLEGDSPDDGRACSVALAGIDRVALD